MEHATQLQKVLTPTVWHVRFVPFESRMNVDPPMVVAVDPFEPKELRTDPAYPPDLSLSVELFPYP